MHHSDLVEVKRSKGRGRGVFARKPIAKGVVIEKAPVIVIPVKPTGAGSNPVLDSYVYEWGRNKDAIVLGYGSLYNHSYTPNAGFEYGPLTMTYRALRDIDGGEEITIDYNAGTEDQARVKFEVV
jgi:SET domain-containing protein